MGEMKYVFISHKNAQRDNDILKRMYEYLSKEKLAAWYDKDLRSSDGEWASQISKKLHGASVYVLIASEESLKSKQVKKEIGLIDGEQCDNGKLMIPFVIDDYYFNMEEGSADYHLGGCENEAIVLSRYPDEQSAFAELVDNLKPYLEVFENNPADFEYGETQKILKKYNGSDSIVTIPSFVEEICEDAFCFNDALEKVIIPPNVKHICARAFYGCKKLIDVEGMQGVEKCDATAFRRSSVYPDAESGYLLNGVVFGGEPNDEGVLALPQGARVIAPCAFLCKMATSIVLPDGIEHIGVRAFADCSRVEEIKIPASLKTIGAKAFDGCSALKRAIFEGGIPDDAEDAFNNKSVQIVGEGK